MAERDGRHLLGEQQGDRLAGDFAGAHDDCLRAAKRDAGRFDQLDNSKSRAWRDQRVAIDDVADVGGVDAFNILHRIDLILKLRRIEMRGDGQMQHDASNRGITIERANGGMNRGLLDCRRKRLQRVADADFFTRLPLALCV